MRNDEVITDDVTTAFYGQSLRKLTIGKVRNMTIASLESIVDAFPELEELSVFAGKWEGSEV